MKNKFFLFISGVATGIILFCVITAIGFVSYILTDYLIDKAESLMRTNTEEHTTVVPSELNLSFESPEELKVFATIEAGAEISDKFYTDGKHSLMVEMPGGRPDSGIFFDIIGKGTLNWEKTKSFSFTVFNGADAAARLNVRIKSGRKYPKRVFMKEFSLSPMSLTKITIKREDLEKTLDLNAISYLGLIMHEPNTTFKLYFDEIKVNY